MGKTQLSKDPYNIVVTGVGGQGNVMASRVLSNMLIRNGYYVTVGETFGASQRGGSVMSHIRVSAQSVWSPQIPKGRADLIVSLEPVEAIRIHENADNKSKGNNIELRNRVLKLLELVQLPNPEFIMDYYPHQLSGGMQQRIMIAMALSCNPDILIADEPTTALDVTIQKEILELLKELQKEFGLSIILISHDLGIIARFCSRVIIFYAGTVMEEAGTDELFHKPGNPYTIGLLDSLPGKSGTGAGERKRLKVIPGQVPDLSDLPDGCKFNPRCSFKVDKCSAKEPEFISLNKNHVSRCHLVPFQLNKNKT